MYKILLFVALIMLGCSESAKHLSTVKVGMTSQEVLTHAGEPDKKSNMGIAQLWVYESADRTVVFRKDTVFDIITSANARIDSIKTSLDNLGDKIESQAEKAGDRLENAGKELKENANDDSLIN